MTMTTTPMRSKNRADIDNKARPSLGTNLTPPIRNASNEVLRNADEKASATPPTKCSSEKDQGTPHLSSKRRRLSDEEKIGDGKKSITSPKSLLKIFESHAQSRKHRREADSDTDTDTDDSDDEEGVAEEEHHNHHCASVLQLVRRMNSMDKCMVGTDELIYSIRATLYEHRPSEIGGPRQWVKIGTGQCKFLRDLEEGFFCGTVYMLFNQEESLKQIFSHLIDDKVIAVPQGECKKPSYLWCATTFEGWSRTLALRFASKEDSLKWKDMLERSKRDTLAALMAHSAGADATDTSAGDEMAEHMKSLSTGGNTSSPSTSPKRKIALKKRRV